MSIPIYIYIYIPYITRSHIYKIKKKNNKKDNLQTIRIFTEEYIYIYIYTYIPLVKILIFRIYIYICVYVCIYGSYVLFSGAYIT